MFCFWLFNKIPWKNMVENIHFKVLISEFGSRKKMIVAHVWFQTYLLSCFDWLKRAHIPFIKCVYYLFASVCSISKLGLWPSGWGGQSPHDPKVRGLTPTCAPWPFIFHTCFILFNYFPILLSIWFYFLPFHFYYFENMLNTSSYYFCL